MQPGVFTIFSSRVRRRTGEICSNRKGASHFYHRKHSDSEPGGRSCIKQGSCPFRSTKEELRIHRDRCPADVADCRSRRLSPASPIRFYSLCRARQTPREVFRHALEGFEGSNVLGAVLEYVDYQRSRYAYTYKYYKKQAALNTSELLKPSNLFQEALKSLSDERRSGDDTHYRFRRDGREKFTTTLQGMNPLTAFS